jgi:CHAD domain-containing protein
MATNGSAKRPRYEVSGAAELPLLGDVIQGHPDAARLEPADEESEHLEVTYLDTADHRLTRAGLTVSRRSGGDAAGWTVDLPAAHQGLPFRLPTGSSGVTVPAAIRQLVWASTRGADLQPVARIVTERTTQRLTDADGQPVVTVTDDRVTGQHLSATDGDTRPPELQRTEWRIVSVDTDVAEWGDAVAAGLHHIGAKDAADATDLGRVWAAADSARDASEEPNPPAAQPSPDSPAGEVVLRYVQQQLSQIIDNDPLVRLDSAGSVHRMRVATRRLRSALDTFRPVLCSEKVDPIRSELKWLAGELGSARDAEVMRDRMLTALQTEDRRGHLGPLGHSVDTEMDQSYRAAHDSLLQALGSDRYHRLVLDLHDLSLVPPLTDTAKQPANRVLPRRAARAYKRLAALARTARDSPVSAERDIRLHEARKAAKKARYAGETLTEFFGKPAARFATAMENLQEELGEHQDSVVMRARLEDLARQETSTAAAFAYGRLHAHEEHRGDMAIRRFEAAWRTAKKKSLRSWIA